VEIDADGTQKTVAPTPTRENARDAEKDEEQGRRILEGLMMHPDHPDQQDYGRWEREAQHRRKWGRHDTQRAMDDSTLPLHHKSVPHLDWAQADKYVAAFAKGEWNLWKDLTRPFRDPSFWLEYEVEIQDIRDSHLLGKDAEELVKDNLLRRVDEKEVKQYAHSFTVIEEAKQRRRWILWPKNFNERCRRWGAARKGHVYFPEMDTLKKKVSKLFARCFDFAAFFHQFRIEQDCALYFCIRAEGKSYAPSTVPTGAVQPPLFAQILCNAICAAISAPGVETDGFIDNIRIASDTQEQMDTATSVLRHVVEKLGITLNEGFEETPTYTFLGIMFDHEKKECSLGQKTVDKLKTIPKRLESATSRADCLSMFGTCVWGAMVLGIARVDMYYIYKFIRRRAAGSMDEFIRIWPSIIGSWKAWAERLSANIPIGQKVQSDRYYTIVTDSSLSGWGGLCYDGTGEAPEKIVGARWEPQDIINFTSRTLHQLDEVAGCWMRHDTRHINMKELVAVRHVVESLDIQGCTIDVIMDNTSALGVLRRQDSPKFEFNREIKRLQETLARKGITLRGLSYVNTACNTADGLSRRGVLPT
jgi:hypothetical protein